MRCLVWIMIESIVFLIRTNVIHMTYFLPRRLNSSCIMFKIITFIVISVFARLYVRIGISITCGGHFHIRIISPRGEDWEHGIKLYTQRKKLSTPVFFWNDTWYDKYHEITDQIVSRTQRLPVRTLHWLYETTKISRKMLI